MRFKIEEYTKYEESFSISQLDRVWPDRSCLGPRDNKSLMKTEDRLFLASMLAALARHKGRIHSFSNRNGINPYIYLIDNGKGGYLSPIGGDDTQTEQYWKQGNNINRRFVADRVKQYYYGARASFINTDGTILMNGATYYDEGVPNKDALEVLNASLKWPFTLHADHLINEIVRRNEMLMNESPEGAYDAMCPLDGPVQIIFAYEISSEWYWNMKCGRFWLLGLCPHCLALLGTRIMVLS